MQKELSAKQQKEILDILKIRFDKNMNRHAGLDWTKVQSKLQSNAEKLWSIAEMEKTGGEPDVVDFNKKTDSITFIDCSAESPTGRRSICYDKAALDARKENKPKNSALNMASEMGIDILDEEQYRALQKLGKFDSKTSSWIKTPLDIRKLGGAIFADYRYGNIFIYHNGADSYYSSRGFRGIIKI